PVINPASNTLERATFNISPVGDGTHPVRSEHRFDELNTDFTQFTLGIDHRFTDRLSFHGFAGMSESEHDVPRQTTILFDAIPTVTGYVYDFSRGANTPFIDFGSLDVNDPSQFAFTEFRDRPQKVDNSFDTVAASL